MRLLALITALCAFGSVASAQTTDPALTAQRAAQMLERAALTMAEADDARDRVDALTETIRAYEEGLSALREGMRRAAIREQSITVVFEAEQERLGRLLGVLQSMQAAPAPLLLIHPNGPVGTARSGMIVSEVTPAVAAEAMELRRQLEELALLRAVQETAEDQLSAGLTGVQEARVALSQAMAERRTLPPRFASDTEALLELTQSAETLDSFATAIRALDVMAADTRLPSFSDQRGQLPLPLQGRVLRGFNQADAAGVTRPGLILAAEARALVSAPWHATVRYAGPLLDYGNVIILEPQGDHLLILAGLGELFVRAGDLLAAGDPVALMGGEAPNREELIVSDPLASGGELSETLYMELRQAGEPVDPTAWFATQDQ
ncbi:murein hydrolase activator EnvC family protein [Nioella sp.]|uniref:murein hydrolase activator EnvC family protein n=1 Tax=Nioella sp. TaxID=1912091 RepID=UPI003B51671E